MIHLRHTKGITNPARPKAESFFLSDALALLGVGEVRRPEGICRKGPAGVLKQLFRVRAAFFDAAVSRRAGGRGSDNRSVPRGLRARPGQPFHRTSARILLPSEEGGPDRPCIEPSGPAR